MPVDEIPSFKVHTSSWGVLDPASRKTFFGVVGSLYKPLVLSTKKHDLTSKPTNRTCSCGRRAGRHHGVVYDPQACQRQRCGDPFPIGSMGRTVSFTY